MAIALYLLPSKSEMKRKLEFALCSHVSLYRRLLDVSPQQSMRNSRKRPIGEKYQHCLFFLFSYSLFPYHASTPFVPGEPYNSIKHQIFQREGKMYSILDFVEELTCLELQHRFFFFLLPSSNSVQRCSFGEITGSLQ